MRLLNTFLLMCLISLSLNGQDMQGVKLSGSIQSDVLTPQDDEKIGAEKTGDVLTNTYAELMLQSKKVDAGIRLEYLEHPLPGFEREFEGWGLPHFWLKARLGKTELTAGTFYEQFGSGLILRTYEDRSLGIDNSILGGRIVVRPTEGITIKALSGKQRHYWKWNKSLVSAADMEVNINEWVKPLRQQGTTLMLGASWVNKHERQEDIFVDATHKLNLPEYVNAWEVRANMNSGPWNLLAEYARVTQNPTFDNSYSYQQGNAMLVSGSYAGKGLSLLLQARRSRNMGLRSLRSINGTSSFINHLPAFTQDHTYSLAALYPYSTQTAGGEWAWQSEAGYHFKRKTALGGKYGMNTKLNFSHVRWNGETYYQDIDIQLTRKMTKDIKLTMMYMNQRYNKTVVEGHGGMVRSNIFIADGLFQLAPKISLRNELQYLTTPDDQGDWMYAIAELTLAPHWMFSFSDMYNAGDTHVHYYQGGVAFSSDAHRLQLTYGRTRAGYNCAGGVCRYVPATRGLSFSYNYTF